MASTAIGIIEIKMMAMMAREKWSRMKGMLPKKYPAKVNSATQMIPPKTF